MNNTVNLDSFNPENLRLRQDFAAELGITKILTECPVRKPKSQEFFRVHPSEEMRMVAALLHLKDENEFCLVTPAVAEFIPEEVKPACLFTAVDREGG